MPVFGKRLCLACVFPLFTCIMRIANPLYDHAFKYLMSHNDLARKVISTILGQEVVHLELNQQEVVQEGTLRGFRIFRLDFKATLRLSNGREEQVLIELQKSKNRGNIFRFRQYLGATYADQSVPNDASVTDLPKVYPLISIYILGYKIDDLPVLAAQVDRRITNLSTGKTIDVRSDFVEHLTHKSYILQIARLPEKRRGPLETFLNLFNQAYVAEEGYILDLDNVPEALEDIAAHLSKPLNEDTMIKQLKFEEIAELEYRSLEAERDHFRTQLLQEKAEKEKERTEKEEIARKLATMMHQQGCALADIVAETGLNEVEVKALIADS